MQEEPASTEATNVGGNDQRRTHVRRSFKDRAEKATRGQEGFRKGALTGVSRAAQTRQSRQQGRARARSDLQRGREPEPRYPEEKSYLD